MLSAIANPKDPIFPPDEPFTEHILCHTSLNEAVNSDNIGYDPDDNGNAYVRFAKREWDFMNSYAKRLDLVANLSFIAPGDEITWQTAEFNAIANCLLEELKKSGRLVYSGVPTYRKMTKHVTKKKKVVDEWHFAATEKNMHTCAHMYMMVAKITHFITQLRKATDPKCTQHDLKAKERIPEALSITNINHRNRRQPIERQS